MKHNPNRIRPIRTKDGIFRVVSQTFDGLIISDSKGKREHNTFQQFQLLKHKEL
jgi:hypothetical protein